MNYFSDIFAQQLWKAPRVITLLFLACISMQEEIFGQEKDSIFLYNGQVLIGEVQGSTLGTLTIDDIDMKMQNVKLYKIRLLKTIHRFKIETIDKKIYYGFLKSSSKNGWIEIIELNDSIPMPITNIFLLISLEKNFFKRLEGNVSAGLSFTKSSNIGQVNLSGNAKFSTKLFNYELSMTELASIDSGKLSRDNEYIQLYAAYEVSPTWFLAAIGQYQRNLELSISRRYLEMFGIGDKIFIRSNWQLVAITGISITQEKSTEGVSRSTLFEIPFMFRFNFYQFHHPDIQISSSQTAYLSLSEPGRVRYDGATNFSWQLIRYFYLTISPYSNYDSKPPANSSSNFDYGIVVGLSYKF